MEAAVVSASQGAMGSLLGKLGDLLADKYKLLKEAKGEIRFLKAELESMHAFLKKMSDEEEPDEQAKCWAKEVRELSYDIEDSIDEFMLRVERESNSKPHGFKGFIDRSINLLTTIHTRHKIAKEFQGLKSRVVEVSERRTRYKIDDAVSKPNSTPIDPRMLALYAETAGLVGIDEPREELIRLMDEEGVPPTPLPCRRASAPPRRPLHLAAASPHTAAGHAATSSHSRPQSSPVAPWNPFNSGGTRPGGGCFGFEKGQSDGFVFGAAPAVSQQSPQPPVASSNEAPFVFGSVRDNLPRQQLKVLSIVGFGGLGKTTLANEIYRKLEGRFQCRSFVSVSQKPNVRKILRDILSQVGYIAPEQTNMEIWDEHEHISTL